MLCFKEPPHFVVLKRLVPEGTDEDSTDLGCGENFTQRPHECAVNAHQLLCVDHVRLVENHLDLVVVLFDDVDDSPKLIGNVQLVRVKEEYYHVGSVGKPANHSFEIVATMESLFLSGENSRSIDETNALKDRTGENGGLKFTEKCVTIVLESTELTLRIDSEGIAGSDLFVRAVHDGDESIGGRLWADSHSGEIPLQKVAEKGRLSRGILTNQQDHGLGIEVTIVEVGRVELSKERGLFQRIELLPIDGFQSVNDIVIDLHFFLLMTAS